MGVWALDPKLESRRALPGAVYVTGDYMDLIFSELVKADIKEIIQRENGSEDEYMIRHEMDIVRLGDYRCNADQVALYDHRRRSNLASDAVSGRQHSRVVKADMISLRNMTMRSFRKFSQNLKLGFRADDLSIDEFLFGYEKHSKVTIFTCTNFTGSFIDEMVSDRLFRLSLGGHSKE